MEIKNAWELNANTAEVYGQLTMGNASHLPH